MNDINEVWLITEHAYNCPEMTWHYAFASEEAAMEAIAQDCREQHTNGCGPTWTKDEDGQSMATIDNEKSVVWYWFSVPLLR